MVAENGHPEDDTAGINAATEPSAPGAPVSTFHSPLSTLAEHSQEPASPAQPRPLSAPDAALLLTFLDTPGSVAHAATARGITAERFLELIANPAALQAIEHMRAFTAARREIRADADREDFIAVLKHVAHNSPNLVEKRRAASAGLRAIDNSLRRAGNGRRDRHTSGGMPAARRSHGDGHNDLPADPYARPWREIRIPRPALSPWEADSPPSPPLGGSGTDRHSPSVTRGAPSSTASSPPHVHDEAASNAETSANSEAGSHHGSAECLDAPAHLLTSPPAHSPPPLPAATPSPSHTPLIAVDIQLATLRANDTPAPDTGIATIHAFYPPAIGDYNLFAETYRDGLKSILGPSDSYTLTLLHDSAATATVRANLIHKDAPEGTPGGKPEWPWCSREDLAKNAPRPRPRRRAVLFHLARTLTPAGNCWLNTAIQFCDTS